MKVFKTSKSAFFVPLLWIIAIGLLALPFIPHDEVGLAVYLIPIFVYAIAALLIWILLDTKYIIAETTLLYRSGPFRGTIKADSIRKLEYDNHIMKGQSLKPALGTKGLVVFYNKFDEIYISPKDREEFIAEITRINPKVAIIN